MPRFVATDRVVIFDERIVSNDIKKRKEFVEYATLMLYIIFLLRHLSTVLGIYILQIPISPCDKMCRKGINKYDLGDFKFAIPKRQVRTPYIIILL